MPGARLRLIILDFDGVVLESNAAKTEAFRDVFARFPEHLDAMMAYHAANVSQSRFAKFDFLLRERLGRPDDLTLRAELAEAFSRRSRERLRACTLVPGALEFLEEFAARVPLYLASVTPPGDLDDTLDRHDLKRWFRDVYGCPPWRKADAVLDAMAREAVPAGSAVLIGDSAGDHAAATTAGVEFVARDSGLPLPPSVTVRYPDLTAVGNALRPRLNA